MAGKTMKLTPRLAWIAAVLLWPALCPAENIQVQMEIEHLIDFVAHSECVFVRNAVEHTSAEAVAHIRRKYDHYREAIDSAEIFIELCAARSMLSGKPYRIRCLGATAVESRTWLLQELARFRQQRNGRQP
jgi:hypothetical protein